MATKTMLHHFIRVAGELLEVQPLTYASTDNPSVKVRIIRTGSIKRVSKAEIINSH